MRGRRKPRVRFSRQPFQTFSAHSRWGGRIAEKTPCRTPATLAVDSIVVDWTGSLELEGCVSSWVFLSFTFFFREEKRILAAMIQFPLRYVIVLYFAWNEIWRILVTILS